VCISYHPLHATSPTNLILLLLSQYLLNSKTYEAHLCSVLLVTVKFVICKLEIVFVCACIVCTHDALLMLFPVTSFVHSKG
jgi:hypothetical protein